MQQIATGDAEIIVAGGQESMSMAPHCAHLRAGVKMGDFSMIDTMIKDGLWDAFNGYHMGNTAENVAREFQITRDQQDEFAVTSQNKAEAAQKAGRFKDEIVPVHDQDAEGRHRRRSRTSTSAPAPRSKAVAKLRPAFAKDGTVTAGNASGINDGAAAVVLMTAAEAAKRGVDAARPHRLVGDRRRRPGDDGHRPDPVVAQGAGEGRLEGRGPRPGRGQRGLRGAGLRGQQGHGLGYRTSSTSMAAPSPSAIRSAPRAPASWSRFSTRCSAANAKKGLATLCIGGGMGIAMCVER